MRQHRLHLLYFPQNQGFTLVMTLALGLIMTLMGTGLIIRAQRDSAIAAARRDTGKSIAVTEAGVSRTLALLKQPQNAALLTHNYDPLNPRTGKTYLGADGALNSGDEGTTAIDEWAGYDPSTLPCYQQAGIGAPNLPLTGGIGTEGTYTLLAYRYDPVQQTGNVLIEGIYLGQSHAIAVTFTLNPLLDNFPGILGIQINPAYGTVGLRNRVVLGRKSNIYFPPSSSADPSLAGVSVPGDATRSAYLNALYASTAQDGATGDNIQGALYACQLVPVRPVPPPVMNTLGAITTAQTLSGTAGQITHYRAASGVDLGNNDTLTIDTTAGPVYLWVDQQIILRNTAKILNIRTDGIPPRVGDFRILTDSFPNIYLYDQTCIQNAFISDLEFKIELLTSASGCPSGRNTNVEGVIWTGVFFVSKNAASNRDIISSNLVHANTSITPGTSSGVYVPDDLTSLIDVLPGMNWPVRYQFGAIKSWNRQRL